MENLPISIDDLREVCGISDAFDANYLEPIIVQSIDLAAENLIGTALMIKIKTDYNSEAGLSGIYSTIWDSEYCSLKKVICWQSYQLGLPRMMFKIGAEGITRGDTIEVDMADSSDLGMLIRNSDASRVMYENRLKKYLRNNQASIPELANTDIDYLKHNTEEGNTSMGMSFGKNINYTNF